MIIRSSLTNIMEGAKFFSSITNYLYREAQKTARCSIESIESSFKENRDFVYFTHRDTNKLDGLFITSKDKIQ